MAACRATHGAIARVVVLTACTLLGSCAARLTVGFDEPRTPMPDSARAAPPPTSLRVVRSYPRFPPGSVVVVNSERALYYIGPGAGIAWRYTVAVGRENQRWTGREFISDKRLYPSWSQVGANLRPAGLTIAGGQPGNPMGVGALYLGNTLWRIHGTNSAASIGQPVSDGCIRMHNNDLLDLFTRANIGTSVYVIDHFDDPPPQHSGQKIAGMYPR
jgi:lipoprotein-anchoring transpeptidase ErfK/SrfK